MDTMMRTTRRWLDRGEKTRIALLSGASFLLGAAFLLLLIADEARAAF